MVVIDRNLPFRTRKADRQTRRRVVRAEQHIGDGVAGLAAQPPGVENRLRMLGSPVEDQRPAGIDQHDDRLAGGMQGLDQIFLHAGQTDPGAALGLAAHAGAFANADHHDIGLQRHGYRFLEAVAPFALDVAAFGVEQFAARAEAVFHTFPLRDDELRIVDIRQLHRPGAQVVFDGLDQRADEGNRLAVGAQGQDARLVLQQHDAFGRHIACRLAVRRLVQHRQLALGIAEAIGIVEQAELELLAQDPAHRIVEQRCRHQAVSDQ